MSPYMGGGSVMEKEVHAKFFVTSKKHVSFTRSTYSGTEKARQFYAKYVFWSLNLSIHKVCVTNNRNV